MKPLQVVDPDKLTADERQRLVDAGFVVACAHSRYALSVSWPDERGYKVTEHTCAHCGERILKAHQSATTGRFYARPF